MKTSLRPRIPRPGFLLALLFLLGPVADVSRVEAATSYQRALLKLHNQDRAKRNRKPLRLSAPLNRAATKYARVMNANNHFSHTGPAPGFSRFDARIKAECATCFTTMGENIAAGQKTPAQVHRAWMNSRGHRANILNPRFRSVGFGRAGSKPYWVTNFGG